MKWNSHAPVKVESAGEVEQWHTDGWQNKLLAEQIYSKAEPFIHRLTPEMPNEWSDRHTYVDV